MSIKMTKRNGWYGVRAYCDCCGAEVKSGKCNVLSSRNIKPGQEADLLIACKNECTKKFDPDNEMTNMEFGWFVLSMAANAGVDIQDEINRQNQMRQISI